MADNTISRRTELEELQHQAGLITDESLESTRRMVTMMEESEEAGKHTMEDLAVQREKLNRIEHGMDHINANMNRAEKSLYKLKQCCSVCATPWKKIPTENESDLNPTNVVVMEQPRLVMEQPRLKDGTSGNPSTGYITRITNDAREDEMDTNLSQVNSILHNLRTMAVDMNTELSTQNDQIKRITDKGDENSIRLQQVNISANDLLKK